MFRQREPVLITSAEEPRQDEIRRREQRYVLTMLFRVVCFILAVVAFSGWLRIVAVGLAVILPWIAVVVANGGPPRSRRPTAGFAVGPTQEAAPAALEAGRHTVVDATVVDATVENDPVVDTGTPRAPDRHEDRRETP